MFCKFIKRQGDAATLSLSSSRPTRLLLLIGPSFPEGWVLGSQGPDLPGCQVHLNQDAASENYQAVTHSFTRQPLCHERQQLVVFRHYTRITNTESRLSSSCSPATQLSGMIVRRARVSCDLPAVKQIEYPPPVSFPSSSFLPCTHHRLVLPTFLSLDTFVRHIALYIHFGSG